MTYYEEHAANGNTLKGGWIMVLVVNLGFVLLTL